MKVILRSGELALDKGTTLGMGCFRYRLLCEERKAYLAKLGHGFPTARWKDLGTYHLNLPKQRYV